MDRIFRIGGGREDGPVFPPTIMFILPILLISLF
jgi:hypothetical protein